MLLLVEWWQVDPKKLSQLDKILLQYKGQEDQLWMLLTKKYGEAAVEAVPLRTSKHEPERNPSPGTQHGQYPPRSWPSQAPPPTCSFGVSPALGERLA